MTIQELINKLQNETTEEQKKLPVMMYVMFDQDGAGGYVPFDEIMIVENGTYYPNGDMFEGVNGTFLILGDRY